MVGQLAASASQVRLTPTWLPIILPVAVAAARFTWRAFTARDRLRGKYAEDVSKVRDRIRSGAVLPLVARVVVIAHPLITWPKEGLSALLQRGDPGNPEDEVRRRLVNRAFDEPLADLALHLGRVRDADALQERLVGAAHRQGCAGALFLLGWLYLGFWVSQTGVDMPPVLTAAAALLSACSGGWLFAEGFASAREAESFALIMAEAAKLPHDEGANL